LPSLHFTWRQAELDILPGFGPYCMGIHGSVYHGLRSLIHEPNNHPRYAQLYILDTEQAVAQRMGIMHKILREQEERAEAEGVQLPNVKM